MYPWVKHPMKRLSPSLMHHYRACAEERQFFQSSSLLSHLHFFLHTRTLYLATTLDISPALL